MNKLIEWYYAIANTVKDKHKEKIGKLLWLLNCISKKYLGILTNVSESLNEIIAELITSALVSQRYSGRSPRGN